MFVMSTSIAKHVVEENENRADIEWVEWGTNCSIVGNRHVHFHVPRTFDQDCRYASAIYVSYIYGGNHNDRTYWNTLVVFLKSEVPYSI